MIMEKKQQDQKRAGDGFYPFREIEPRWQQRWEEQELYKTNPEPKNKFYILVMFAYPSGDIHMGHFRNYSVGDAVARRRMMEGYDILHPFGWDAVSYTHLTLPTKRIV